MHAPKLTSTDTDFSNWTVIGFPSTIVDKNKATMSLNFRNMNKQEIRAMVIHQFGHALGLGHALMRPEDWADIEEYVDVEKMARDSHDEDRKDVFESEWTGKQLGADVLLNYDEKSVMQYRYYWGEWLGEGLTSMVWVTFTIPP